MTRFLIFFLLFPLLSPAQKRLPRFENDTLYTTTGYHIYKNIKLRFGKSVRGEAEKFKYINIKSGHYSSVLSGSTLIVKKMHNFGVSQLNNSYIEIFGTVVYKSGTKAGVDVHIAIDSAIRFGEIIMPEDQSPEISSTGGPQKNLPRFEQDTLFTTSGPLIFPGKELQIGKGSGKRGSHKYISVISNGFSPDLTNSRISVTKLSRFGIDDRSESFIEIHAVANFKDGSTGSVHLRISFDYAIATSELIIPTDH